MKNIFSSKIFSGISVNLTTGSIGAALVAAILVVVGSSLVLNTKADNDRQYLSYAGELRILSQRIAKNALEAAGGTQDAFTALRQSRNAFDTRWTYLKQGNSATGLPPITAENISDVSSAISELDVVWTRARNNADQIIENQESVLSLHKITRELADVIPDIQEEYDDIVEILLEVNAPSDQVVMAQRQSLLAEKIIRSANKVLAGGADAVNSSRRFDENTRLFGRVLNAMLEGNVTMRISRVTDGDALGRLEEAKEAFEIIKANVGEIVETSPQLFSVRGAADTIFVDSQTLLDRATKLLTAIETLPNQRLLRVELLILAGAVTFILFIALVFVVIGETRKNLTETEATNQRNQAAILRLLDELADLADGNLNVQATVTEDFTGAIADSINFSIDQMRILVSQINETSVQVSSAAQETQATAMHLAEASEHQAQEIAGASAAVNEMAVSIDQVSYNAAESSAVAERAVAIANKGAEVVQNTINGMDNIRSQIQETSKRIKRLGESTQEIGDIVSLINDIADQTNILALNAAIQAAMAGDAGRGFAVVADEVQRLAERASAATKQIEALVKTIQTDTNEAVISMEQTTAEVVQGARLAQDAGVALEEIENVSTTLAELIQNISNAARQQASSAGHISNTMNVIQEITSQTSAGTNATARSISNLAELANQMRRSVAGFKLPDSHITLDA